MSDSEPRSAPPHHQTPPRDTSRVPHSTPIAHKFSGDFTFNSERIDATKARMRLARETIGHWIGPMPPDLFTEEFLPLGENGLPIIPTVDVEIFKKVPKVRNQKDMYEALKTVISPFCPTQELVYTNSNLDPSYELAPDIGFYPQNRVPDRTTCFHSMNGWAELKVNGDADPFHDPGRNVDRENWVFERPGIAASTRGQLACYGAAHRDSRFRLHSFSLFIHGRYARLLRWGTNSAIVTERFDYTERPQLLANFLWRFSHASAEMLGEDPTVTVASKEDSVLCHDQLNLSPGHLIYKVDVPSRADPKKNAPYLMPRRTCRFTSPFGRVTRSTHAVKLEQRGPRVVFLKDYHRALIPGLFPEGEIYEKLEKAGLPHIAEFDEGAVGMYKGLQGIGGFDATSSLPDDTSTVGRPLTEFQSSHELVKAMSDAMEAHSAAYFDAHILHRDISVGNILIIGEGKKTEGLLIDWDISAVLDESWISNPLRKQRTGTWQFISCNLLQQPSAAHTLLDDRESCLWVLIWITLLYSATRLSKDDVRQKLGAFDECFIGEKSAKGGRGKRDMLTSGAGKIKLHDERSGLHGLLQKLKELFAPRYIEPALLQDRDSKLAAIGKREWLSKVFNDHLGKGNWPTSDVAELQPVEEPLTTNRKRNSDQAELDSRAAGLSQMHRISGLGSSCKKPKSGQAESDEGFSEGDD